MINRRKFVKIMGAAGAAAIVPWRFDLKNGWQAGAAYAAVNSPGLKLFAPAQTLRGVGGPTGIPVAASDGNSVAWLEFLTRGLYVGGRPLHHRHRPVHRHAAPWHRWGRGCDCRLGYHHSVGLQPRKPRRCSDPKAPGRALSSPPRTPRSRSPSGTTCRSNSIIPVDTTINGVNPAQVNRTAVHIHGGYVPWISDGGPYDWCDPAGVTAPVS